MVKIKHQSPPICIKPFSFQPLQGRKRLSCDPQIRGGLSCFPDRVEVAKQGGLEVVTTRSVLAGGDL